MNSNSISLPCCPAVVWLDLDDTLIDFHTNSRLALRQLYHAANLTEWIPDEEIWVDEYEKYNTDLWRRYALEEITRDYLRIERMRAPLRQHFTGSSAELDELALRLDPCYLDLLACQKELVPGAMQLLESLRSRGYRLGILSNGFEQVQYRKMDTAGITPYIDFTVLSDHIGINKPGIEIYRHAMKVSGVPEPTLHLIVGDNLATDITGGINAGWEAVYFNPSGNKNVDFNGSYFTVCNLEQVLRLLPD